MELAYFAEWSKAVVAWTLLLAGVAKLREPVPEGFFRSFRLLRVSLWRGLMVTEIALGALLISGDPYGVASLLSATLLSAFLVYGTVMTVRGSQDNCSCFGQFLPEKWGRGAIARNTALVFLAAIAVAPNVSSASFASLSLLESIGIRLMGLAAIGAYGGTHVAITSYRTWIDGRNAACPGPQSVSIAATGTSSS